MNQVLTLRRFLAVNLLIFVFSAFVYMQPAPKDVLGFTPGEDYKLANWSKIVEYFQKLDAASDRVVFKTIGKTTLGKPFSYALISSPQNLRRLDYYKDINDKLADPRKIGRSMSEARKLAKKGKTFVLITHGIHSTEVGSTLTSTVIAHRLATSKEKRIRKILDNTIIVIVPSLNPDGVDIVKNWYDKTLGTKHEGTSPPELYHKYVGHDNNRDWYAFTQVETQMTVEKIHNVYHPQIVHDIHQQGRNGARFFVPPYLDPVEPNVPKEIVEGYTEIGEYIADKMRKSGKQGITTASTYDAWTPARAYSHYHGGARILSETASARLASPVTIDPKDLSSRRGFDVNKVSRNYGPLWKGGRWGIGDIVDYMQTGAFHLLDHAAANREKWLKRFHTIGYDATRPRKSGELNAFVIEPGSSRLVQALKRAGVEVEDADAFSVGNKRFRKRSKVVRLDQPYGSFAVAMMGRVQYPNLIDDLGNPIPPYDVTAHDLALLTGVEAMPVYQPFKFPKPESIQGFGDGGGHPCNDTYTFGAFRSSIPSMDEGWTRWVIERFSSPVRFRYLNDYCKVEKEPFYIGDTWDPTKSSVVFPDQSPNQILNGYPDGSMPKDYVGGVGTEGVAKLKKYVEDGGTLVFMNNSSNFAIEQFGLPIKNIAKDWERKDFYIPGSILRIELDTAHPVAKSMDRESIAWFQRSPVFEVQNSENASMEVNVIAKYPEDAEKILLSGWAHGKERIAGKAALVEVKMGKGKIVLFGFRPQYRGQAQATFPLMFNALSY
ncbi:MAG: hypothetical protein HKN33_15720 [Pyrinomonadaceae bacterium]|nr:hypothetical protein [Pyrinomonadaceae bacterium]